MAVLLTVLLFSSGCLTACGRTNTEDPNQGTAASSKTETVPYSTQQMLLVLLSQKKHVQEVYTDKIWDTKVMSDGTPYKDIFFDEMKTFFCDMATMNRLAEEKNIQLSAGEKKKLDDAALRFTDSSVKITEALKNMTAEETAQLFEQYILSGKVKDVLISENRVEVSDSEAKVIVFDQIVVNSQETADGILSRIQAGEDFYSLAQEYSDAGDIAVTAGRSDLKKEVADAAFSLENDEVSGIIQADGRYYILKCVNSYDREETAIRKKLLEKERLRTTVRSVYVNFAAQHAVTMDAADWSRVLAKSSEEYEGEDFFSAVKEAVKNEGV